jgi:hypothetical protein
MARFTGASPRHKPQEMLAADQATAEVRSVLVPEGTADTGVSFIGGPQQFGSPVEATATTQAQPPVSAPAVAPRQ